MATMGASNSRRSCMSPKTSGCSGPAFGRLLIRTV